ncbi:MATE family efflux transporter [Ruminococcus gauvreauii]|uniref:Probable multidrug resistance protein NorM n=1 Tax=Ruminococcus gauvreauii TaxID=438033 RepID=A0ABY5VID2_9FIRM|nr:MATE family efflux transporter [Ruminococcus gauvreauii]UWP60072.1 MATE family efflux transporter [Ruminococcus gauvreauii]
MLFSNKDLRKLIIPLIIEQVLAITVGMVDTAMVSMAGEAAISGVSLVDMIVNLMINIFAALATGGAVIVSQYLGKRKRETACEAANQLLLISLVISVVIMAVMLIFRQPILSLIYGDIEPEVMQNALTYLVYISIGFPFLALFNSCAALFRSMGNSRISMQAALIMNIINVAGDTLLIYGLHMGAAGAAIASTFSRFCSAVILIYCARSQKNEVYIRISHIFRANLVLIRKILYIGIPSGIESGLFQLGRVLVVSIIAGFGTAQIAANAVANNLDALGVIAGLSINLAVITVIGRCMGAGDSRQAAFYMKKLLKITYLLTLCTNIVLLGGLPWILNIYSLSPEAYHYAFILVWIHNVAGTLIWPLSFMVPNALRAAGDVKYTMFISIFSMVVFRLAASVILGSYLQWGAIGVWIAMVLDWSFRTVMFGVRYKKGKWKKMRIV